MTRNHTPAAALILVLLCAVLGGCATQPVREKDPRDPWQGFNRSIWNFDYGFYEKVGLPIARGYIRVVPQPVRHGVTNFVANAEYPIVIVNDLLQGKIKQTGSDTGRFLLNSTVGLAGLLDPGTAAGLVRHDNDLGMTFGVWGLPPGPYLVVPFVGPTTIRDGIGRLADGYISPQYYINDIWVELGFDALYVLDVGATTLVPEWDLLQAQHVYDSYTFVRNVYLQRRDYLIHGQSPKSEQQQEEDLEKSLEESAGESPAPPASAPPSSAPAQPSPPPQSH
jgi:phospholipid-binding lipoprotein MlaA